MAYHLEGRLLEVCDCRVLCPCWIGEDPDNGTCDTVLAYHFDAGLYARYQQGAVLMSLNRPVEAIACYQDVSRHAGNGIYVVGVITPVGFSGFGQYAEFAVPGPTTTTLTASPNPASFPTSRRASAPADPTAESKSRSASRTTGVLAPGQRC